MCEVKSMDNETRALLMLFDVSLKMLEVNEMLGNGDKSSAVETLKEINAILDDIEKLLDE